ncbi:MAG: hypothetical protein RLW42_03910, partial [Gammaproteobacteria bacterium]
HWIRRYDVPHDQASARRELIDQLTKRVFHHTEPGINTPGYNLPEARRAYESESDPERKRVNAAMLAGALLNRGSDIFTMIFELNRRGIEITPANELMLECESCFLEAFDLGKQVKHYSGEEGLDELWGEPLKVFYMPVADFYESRYIKIALTMSAIDSISARMLETFTGLAGFAAVPALIEDYSRAAKNESETIKTDPAIFKVWPAFVVAGDHLSGFVAERGATDELRRMGEQGVQLVREGKRLIEWIAFARVPMPKTTANYFERLAAFKRAAAAVRAA